RAGRPGRGDQGPARVEVAAGAGGAVRDRTARAHGRAVGPVAAATGGRQEAGPGGRGSRRVAGTSRTPVRRGGTCALELRPPTGSRVAAGRVPQPRLGGADAPRGSALRPAHWPAGPASRRPPGGPGRGRPAR